MRNPANNTQREKVLIVGLQFPDTSAEEFEYSLAELDRLVDTAGGTVQHYLIQKRQRPDPAAYLGTGKLAELRAILTESPEISTVVFDNELNSRQVKNLSDQLGRKVIDRTELILDIFAGRAKTKEAQLEVELAQLEYLLPRLTHRYENLSRLGGGIGTRGPGETQLESDRRVIKKKISVLKKRIKEVAEHRDLQRQGRQRKLQQVVSIVGYTNSGKSTLLQALSKKSVYIKDQLFATLDPVIRTVFVKQLNKEILFADTVGFIKNLPHHLIDSFKSTLEEVAHADLILHVVDAAATDYKRQIDTVFEVLHSLQVTDKKIITVFNKLDLQPDLPVEQLREEYAPAVFISALQRQGVEDLLAVVADLLK